MLEDKYEFSSDESQIIFEFFSEGPKGKIEKLIKFSTTNYKNFYNLGFGDKDPFTGEINDLAVTDNGDRDKVLATVAATVYIFTENKPDVMVFASGSTKTRTRLYQMGITRKLAEIQQDFEVYGLLNDKWHDFVPGRNYDGFVVKRKNL